ncbi:hypothetical protein BDAP_001378, partial [Binucleata daphniae]
TKNVICEYYKSNFYNNIGNITELQKKIVDDLENTKDDENNTLKTIIKSKNIVNILQLQLNNLLKISTQEQNKEVGETNKTEVSTSELAENKDIEKFFTKNKLRIYRILQNTILLKRLIIKAEQDAFDLSKNIKAYNNDGDGKPKSKKIKLT